MSRSTAGRRARPTARPSARATQAHGRHKKQSGGHGQFGDVKIEIRPRARGEGFQFENKIVGGAVPRQYIPAVEAGAREHLQRGPLGFPVVDVGVTLHDGQFHSVDSNELAFKLATALALQGGPAAVRAGAARADPERRPSRCRPTTPRKALQLVIRQARPDPGLRGQGRLERLGRDQRPRSRRARCTT